MTAKNKAKYFKDIFNNDINACVRLCNRLIATCFLSQEVEYYQEVRQILETSK